MKKSVVLAVDGSERSQDLLRFASEHLDPEDQQLIVTSVAEELPGDLLTPDASRMDPDQLEETMETSAEEYAQQAAEQLRSDGFDVTVETRVGKPGEQICDLAEKRGVQQIILGKRGRSEVRELLLGSTSQYVLHRASCAVTILPEG